MMPSVHKMAHRQDGGLAHLNFVHDLCVHIAVFLVVSVDGKFDAQVLLGVAEMCFGGVYLCLCVPMAERKKKLAHASR